jgi:hypothetical protein
MHSKIIEPIIISNNYWNKQAGKQAPPHQQKEFSTEGGRTGIPTARNQRINN